MRKALLVGLLALTAIATPTQAQFCPGASGWVYDDVLASDPFCGYITWMAQNGVSLGCQIVDANHRLYCPNANVTRTQMAAFMNRLTTQPDSASATVGTITKPGGVFLHNGGVNNTYLGVGAGSFSSTASDNVGVGSSALMSNVTGVANTAVGSQALARNQGGASNSAFGNFTLQFNTSGDGNTALGSASMSYNVDGSGNTAIGSASLVDNVSGSYNTAVGFLALKAGSASGNVAVGARALEMSALGVGNVALGSSALSKISTNSGNIAIGDKAGLDLTDGDYNIYIGNAGASTESHAIRIGDSQTRTFVAGIRGKTTGANDAVVVVVDSNGQLGTISSSRKAKDDVADMSEASAGLMRLRPVTFHYRSDHDPAGPRLQYGLIAEEVAEVYPGLVATKDGKPETVMYQYLPPMLLNEFQKQQRTIEAQAREIERQRVEIAEVKATQAREIAEVKASQAREIADLRQAVEVLMARTASGDRVAAR